MTNLALEQGAKLGGGINPRVLVRREDVLLDRFSAEPVPWKEISEDTLRALATGAITEGEPQPTIADAVPQSADSLPSSI